MTTKIRTAITTLAATFAIAVAAMPAHAMKTEKVSNPDVVDCRGAYCTRDGALDVKATCAAKTWASFCR